MRFVNALAVAASFVALAAFVGCGSSTPHEDFGTDSGGGGGGPDGGVGDGPQFGFGDGGEGGGGCDLHCSADLHTVLDCNQNIVTTCPPTQGCGPGGTCIAACDSAKANKSTIGCDYYSVDPGTDGESNGSCFAAFIANTWTSPVTLTADYNGQTLNMASMARIPQGQGAALTYAPLPNNQLPPGQVAILFLADATSLFPPLPTRCPSGVTAGFTASEASSEQTGIIHGFHITSSAPVVAYDIFPYGGAQSYISSATLLIPTSAWDKNYIAVDAFAKSAIAGPTAQPFIEIAAAEDGTTVTISPTAAIVGGAGVAPTGQGQPHTYALNRGEVLQLKQDAELNGSPILSNKPVGVWGGNSCMNIDVSDSACDSGHQELFPVSALGHEYVAARYRNRSSADEAPPWRMVGAVNGTTLAYDPAAPTGAPTTLAQGQVAMFYASAPFIVKSQDDQHPFYMSGHMGGQNFHGVDYTTGDPDFVNTVPPQEYLASYVFMTDPTFSNTNLVLVRTKSASGFKDVTLDCLPGPVQGWAPIGSSGLYQVARADLVVAGAPVGGCNNGRHEIKSDAPFGLTVWGWDTTVSYAYPSGASVQPINTVVVPPIPK